MSTISTKPIKPTPFTPAAPVPPSDGEPMLADEFIRRYEAMPEEWQAEHKRAELIEGVVRMPPVSGGSHAEPQFDFMGFLCVYRWATPGVLGYGPASIILDTKTMPEPDSSLAIDPMCGGAIQLDEKGYIHGAPELVAEFSSSRLNYDLNVKKELYRSRGIKEFIVWRVKERAIDWHILRGEQYELLPSTDGVYRSEVFPGLWLASASLLDKNYPHVYEILQQGLASKEHVDFVARLRTAPART